MRLKYISDYLDFARRHRSIVPEAKVPAATAQELRL